MAVVFMSHPTAVLRQYLKRYPPREDLLFGMGRLSMALEIMTQIKVLESLPYTQLTVQLASAFRTLLVDTDMADEAEKWYERLDAWRTPKFVEDHGISSVRGGVSALVAPEGALVRSRRHHSSLALHHDPGTDMTFDATSSSEESPSASDQATQSE
jgi:hypothetical protein